ncbi:dihydroxyacetone kinase 1 [Trichomonascus vanleenenianus]|uniref:dihydroxyacetone kinase 1 n=1 Tax=Trichomonascus vanleenenianus TaxID=2268995 RepID=UPI003ECA4994
MTKDKIVSPATKHFFSSQDGLVVSALKGLAATNPSLRVIEHDKVLFNSSHKQTQVSVLCGGGAGHEPHSAGFVGEGMLSAAVSGEIFASPNTKQIETACKAVPSDEGYVFIVTNYTGDMLHFGLACEKLKSSGKRAALIKSADDVSVGRASGGLVGRRGLSGTIIMHKVLGAAASEGFKFAEVEGLGHAMADSLVTINAGLDHCHVPGRGEDYGQLTGGKCEIGLGIHNEPGVELLDDTPEAGDLVKQMLDTLLDPNDTNRAFVPFDAKDKVVMLINNLGGVSMIEQLGLTNLSVENLKEAYGISPVRVYSGHFMTSLNAPIFAITLFNVSYCASKSGVPEEIIFKLLDRDTDAASWPVNHYPNIDPINVESQLTVVDTHHKADPIDPKKDLRLDPQLLDSRLRDAAKYVIDREPELTDWDTKMGDGDCGKTLEAGSKALLEALDSGLAKSGSVTSVLEHIIEITEDHMGGTLGAIFGIFFAAFSASVKSAIKSSEGNVSDNAASIIIQSASEALASLRKHTPASEGDRTVMDVMIPFIAKLQTSQSLPDAARAAQDAAEGTKTIKPKLGRATYVGGLDKMSILPPDPGAWGAYELIRGLAGL